jgi:predicted AAA+ superfamily ATPase
MTLTNENHWHKEGGLWRDPDLDRVKKSLLSYRPRPFRPTDCQPDAVLTLRGPRRAGKTVALKLLVAELLEEKHFEPREVFWSSFEALRTLEQVEERLHAIAARPGTRAVFIDEVTSVTGWQRVIKKFKDEGHFRNAVLILTGSSAHDLKKGAERMAGRRGKVENPDRVLLPMPFSEFERQIKGRVGPLPDSELLSLFFRVGGFPFRVESYLEKADSPGSFDPFAQFQVFDDVFFYEINRRRLDRNIAIEIAARLSQVRSHAISRDALAKPLTVSRETAKRYIDALGDSFLLATIFSFDISRSRVAPKKDRKFLWIDPALADFAAWMGAGEPAGEPEKAEMVVAAELLRRYERRLWEGLSAPRNVFTWKSSGGNEIDFLVLNPARKIRAPYEVKFQAEISDWDFQIMERAFQSGTLLTKNITRAREKSRAVALAEFLRAEPEVEG